MTVRIIPFPLAKRLDQIKADKRASMAECYYRLKESAQARFSEKVMPEKQWRWNSSMEMWEESPWLEQALKAVENYNPFDACFNAGSNQP